MSLKGSLAKLGENNPNYKDGLSKTKEYHRNHYLKNPDKVRQYNQRSHQLAKDFRDNLKAKPCSDCQIHFPSYVMHFDHRAGAIKKFNIGSMVGRIALSVLKAEIEKCDLVCANCHAVRTHNRRIKCVS